jgi:hypothetical protein
MIIVKLGWFHSWRDDAVGFTDSESMALEGILVALSASKKHLLLFTHV